MNDLTRAPFEPGEAAEAAEAAEAGDAARYRRRVELFDALARQPWAHDFFAVLRHIDTLWPDAPRLGTALRPGAEAVRLGQDPELEFAPAAVMSFKASADRPPRVGVRFFGLFGSMGPLPLHLTEYARDRARNHGDATLVRFADVFHHRMLLLFYRAWAQAQPAVQADRAGDDQFAKWLSALFGQGPSALRQADTVPDAAKRYLSGHLARATRSPESITKVLRQYFAVPIRVESHVGQWLSLRAQERSRLGGPGSNRSARLGVSAVAGSKVWDRQYRLRLHIGPMSLAEYLQFLPGQRSLRVLRDWMRQLLGFEMLWDVRLILQAGQIPLLELGAKARQPTALGLTTWLGRRRAPSDQGTLYLQPARLASAPAHHKEPAHG